LRLQTRGGAMETGVMGRPKAKAAARKPAAGKARDRSGEKPTVVTIKGEPAWREWVERGAKWCRTDVAKLIDSALVMYLRTQGFSEQAPER
jgi:hypothetical protein